MQQSLWRLDIRKKKRLIDEYCRGPLPCSHYSAFDFTRSAVCLISNAKIASMKQSNIKWHFDTRHATFASKHPARDSRKKACHELLCRVPASQQKLCVLTQQGDWNSVSIAESLAIMRNEKPFTDEEYTNMPPSRHSFLLLKPIIPVLWIARSAVGGTLREEDFAVLLRKGTTREEDLFKIFTEFARKNDRQTDELISVCADGQFKSLLDEIGNNCPDLLLHRNVRWLSRRKVLSCFTACLSKLFGNEKCPELSNTERFLKFYYLVNMAGHLSQLYLKMQGVTNTVLSLQKAVFAFENKLELFHNGYQNCDPVQHLHLQQHSKHASENLAFLSSSPIQTDLRYIPGVSIREFELRAADLKASDIWVKKFESLNEDLEILARQQAELASKHKWEEMKKRQPARQLIVKTWNALPVTYHTLQLTSIAVLTMFGVYRTLLSLPALFCGGLQDASLPASPIYGEVKADR
uniref:Uncharacterized protein n=1 Tax=Oryzias latipes TaxID=8090 RepID=A0A3P9I4G7_ORYLA